MDHKAMTDNLVITPDSNVSMPLWRFVTIMGGLVLGAIGVWRCYDGLQRSIGRLGEDVVGLRADLAKVGPAAVRDWARDVVREEMRKAIVIECPRHALKGDSVVRCQHVLAKGE